MDRRTLLKAGLTTTMGLTTMNAWGRNKYPASMIRILTPYNPGSMVDMTARMVADRLSAKFEVPVIVENRSGGHGSIAMNAMFNASADGHTLVIDTPASAMNPSLYKESQNYVENLAPVAQLMSLPAALAVNPSLPVNTIQEFVQHAKRAPGKLNAAVAGTSTQLMGLLFALQAGIEFQSIPYRGASPSLMSTMAGETDLVFLDIANIAPFAQSGKLKCLLTTSDQRWPGLPEVPTAKESGYPEFDVQTWFALFAKKGTPKGVLEVLNQATQEVMESPEVKKLIDQRGASYTRKSVSEFTDFYLSEHARWGDVIAKSNIKVE